MAKAAGKSKRPEPPKSTDPTERILLAAMDVATRIGWRRAALADIADAAGVSLAELHGRFADKGAILRGIVDLADRKVLAGADKPDPETSPRDRLFDVLMRRFDALKPYREGLGIVAREGGGVGVADAICGAQRMLRSLAWMLEAAGVPTGGWAGACRVKGLAVVYAATFAAWLRDDSEDMSKTMAALDRNLGRAERFANTFNFRRTSGPAEAGAEDGRRAGGGRRTSGGEAGAPA